MSTTVSPVEEQEPKRLHIVFAEKIVLVMYTSMIVCTTLQVVFRHAFGSLPWTEELARYSFMWLVYISMVLALNRGAHASMDFVFSRTRGVTRFWMNMFIHLLTVALFATLCYHGIELFLMTQGQSSPATRMSMMVPYASLPFGCILMLIEEFFLIRKLLQSAKGGSF